MLTIAYIGNGKSTNRYHLPFALKRNDLFKVKTIYNRQISVFSWHKHDTIHYTDNLSEVLNDPEIDAVVICTPSPTHYEMARKVIEHGKHCLVEKPFMESFEQAKEIFELAREKDVVVMPYQNRRFDSDFLTLKQVIANEILGKVYEVNLNFDTDRPEGPSTIQSNSKDTSYLYGIGSHAIDQALSLFGKPRTYNIIPYQTMGPGRMNDGYSLTLLYPGLTVHVSGSHFRIIAREVISAYGTDGIFIKRSRDQQETYLKQFKFPGTLHFGYDEPEQFGQLITRDGEGKPLINTLETAIGDYSRFYEFFYNVIKGREVFDASLILLQMEILEEGYNKCL